MRFINACFPHGLVAADANVRWGFLSITKFQHYGPQKQPEFQSYRIDLSLAFGCKFCKSQLTFLECRLSFI